MERPPAPSDGWSIRAPGVWLEFRWVNDRWVHWLDVGTERRRITVAVPIESDHDRDDPAVVVSPAYQQIEFQKGTDRVGALLLGQSGPHHFSAVFAVWEGPTEVGIEVDVADRCRQAVRCLACTYEVDLRASELRRADSSRVTWAPHAFPESELSFEALDGAQVAVAEQGRLGLRVQAIAPLTADAKTYRCRYRWACTRPRETQPTTAI